MPKRLNSIAPFDDHLVAHWSDEDGCWTAHSLRTDQIGTGPTRLDALADLMLAVYQVCELAAEDDSIQYLREAPPEVQRLASVVDAIPPDEVEAAHRIARQRLDDSPQHRDSSRPAWRYGTSRRRLQST